MSTTVAVTNNKEISSNKDRKGKCRKWEQQRRLKFNEAVIKLGNLVKSATHKDNRDVTDTTQYAKIEIIQQAITFIAGNLEEISRLKSEILSLQVKIDCSKNKKDASSQCVRVQHNNEKEKAKVDHCVQDKLESEKTLQKDVATQISVGVKSKLKDVTNKFQEESKVVNSTNHPKKLPTLLPKANKNDKKAPKNTIVVVPAAPYVLPQRPFIFPAAPPTFVLLNPTVPSNKKLLTCNRTTQDSTKTTMVNILPISAYSHSISSKVKKNKSPGKKNNIIKKKTGKSAVKPKIAELNSVNETLKEPDCEPGKKALETSEIPKHAETDPITVKDNTNKEQTGKCDDIKSGETKIPSNNIDNVVESNTSEPLTTLEGTPNKSSDKPEKCPKLNEKQSSAKDVKKIDSKAENKQTKLVNILDTALCDNNTDVGNARLELAEELLAASPTAAFLMSFPLVSGNRADSPSEETHNVSVNTPKDSITKKTEISQTNIFFNKSNVLDSKDKTPCDSVPIRENLVNAVTMEKAIIMERKKTDAKASSAVSVAQTEPTFLNLQIPSVTATTSTMPDAGFSLDYDCNISKSFHTQTNNFSSSSNLFYKGDFNNVKSSIYSTSAISSGHEFNTLGLYPCAVDKYTTKEKNNFPNMDENFMKIGSTRLTYDIDLGWSHKSLDFVNCPNAPTLNKENFMTSVSGAHHSTYNPFNPEFHVPVVGTSNKKDTLPKTSSFSEAIVSSATSQITNLYSQTPNLWSDETPFYTNSNNINTIKQFNAKQPNYMSVENLQNTAIKNTNPTKMYDNIKTNVIDNVTENVKSTVSVRQQMPEKFTKKSPSKMHINWMTSEIRPPQNIFCNSTHTDIKEQQRPAYSHYDQINKKHESSDIFPIPVHNYSTQISQDEFQTWPSTRTVGTTEITIEPPPINLPTLIGDLALGPHDKKKHGDNIRVNTQADMQNCNNFLSVTQLMNSSSETTRFPVPNTVPNNKTATNKQNVPQYWNHASNKTAPSRTDTLGNCYPFNDSKIIGSVDNNTSYQNIKKPTKNDKSSKNHKNNYSAEALIRGGTASQKYQEDKFAIVANKYNDYNVQPDNSIAQVSHFPTILDYTDNNYSGQQFSGASLYNSTSNTISNSFYTNFMTNSSNIIPSNYSTTPFAGDFIDYSQSNECTYTNHKYDELKMKANAPVFSHDKNASGHRSSKRESATKHKLECSKKESNKRYQSKKSKISADAAEDWTDNTFLWHNKTLNKRHTNMIPDEISFPSYVGNQIPSQYQPDIFNSHLVPPNMQGATANVDRSLASFPASSRANFNLSTIFPEITMKVQS